MEKYREAEVDYSGETAKILGLKPSELAEFIKEIYSQGELEGLLDEVVKDDQLIAQLSYWEKWFPEKIRKKIDERIAIERKDLLSREDCLPLDLESKFTEEELNYIFSHLGAIQPTFGCSKACSFCGFDAVRGVREEIPFAQLKNLFEKYGRQMGVSKFLLYYASEPSDYDRYPELHDLAVKYAYQSPDITTNEGNDEWVSFLEKIRSSIRFSLGVVRKEDAFKDYRTVVIDGEEHDIRVVSSILRGSEGKHKKGIGVSYESSEKETDNGIGCLHGSILLTPRGLYRVSQTKISEEYPQGQMVVPLGPLSDIPIKVGRPSSDNVAKDEKDLENIKKRLFENAVLLAYNNSQNEELKAIFAKHLPKFKPKSKYEDPFSASEWECILTPSEVPELSEPFILQLSLDGSSSFLKYTPMNNKGWSEKEFSEYRPKVVELVKQSIREGEFTIYNYEKLDVDIQMLVDEVYKSDPIDLVLTSGSVDNDFGLSYRFFIEDLDGERVKVELKTRFSVKEDRLGEVALHIGEGPGIALSL